MFNKKFKQNDFNAAAKHPGVMAVADWKRLSNIGWGKRRTADTVAIDRSLARYNLLHEQQDLGAMRAELTELNKLIEAWLKKKESRREQKQSQRADAVAALKMLVQIEDRLINAAGYTLNVVASRTQSPERPEESEDSEVEADSKLVVDSVTELKNLFAEINQLMPSSGLSAASIPDDLLKRLDDDDDADDIFILVICTKTFVSFLKENPNDAEARQKQLSTFIDSMNTLASFSLLTARAPILSAAAKSVDAPAIAVGDSPSMSYAGSSTAHLMGQFGFMACDDTRRVVVVKPGKDTIVIKGFDSQDKGNENDGSAPTPRKDS